MSENNLRLAQKLSELLAWERTKRRENILLGAWSFSFLAASALLPGRGLLPGWVSPFWFPLVSFLVFAPAGFLLRPWRETDSLRALCAIDRTLGLSERTLTAAEILKRSDHGAAEQIGRAHV